MEGSAPSSAPAAASASSTSQAASSSSASSAGQTAPSTNSQTAAPPQASPFRLKLSKPVVVDGVEEALEYDDEEKLRVDLQLAKAARKRMQEAARDKKALAEMQASLKDGEKVWEALKAAGHDPDALAAARLQRQYEMAQLTPEQRAVAEAQQRAEAAEARAKAIEEKIQQEAQQKADAAVWAEFEPKLLAAAEKAALPTDAQTMDLLGRVGLEFANAGIELAPEQIVAEVERRQGMRVMKYLPSAPVKMLAGAVKSMPVDKLMAVLSEAGLYEPVRQAMVAAWRAKRTGAAAPVQQPAAPAPTNGQPRGDDGKFKRSDGYITAGEFRKQYSSRR